MRSASVLLTVLLWVPAADVSAQGVVASTSRTFPSSTTPESPA